MEATWSRVGVVAPAGSGTVAQPSTPATSVITWRVPAARFGQVVGEKR